MLSQEQLDQSGVWRERVIAYASKKLSNAEQSYSSFKVWDCYLLMYSTCKLHNGIIILLGRIELFVEDGQEVQILSRLEEIRDQDWWENREAVGLEHTE